MLVAKILSMAVGVAASETPTVAGKNALDVEPTSLHIYSA